MKRQQRIDRRNKLVAIAGVVGIVIISLGILSYISSPQFSPSLQKNAGGNLGGIGSGGNDKKIQEQIYPDTWPEDSNRLPDGLPIDSDIACQLPYIEVWTAEDLSNVRNDLDGCYIQMADIDLAAAGYNNWEPIGDYDSPFIGNYNGNQFEIKNLKINRPDEDYVGLFGASRVAILRNIKIIDSTVSGRRYVGTLAGYFFGGELSSSYVINGYLAGYSTSGGLLGQMGSDKFSENLINKSFFEGSLEGTEYIGGLVGRTDRFFRNKVENSFSIINIRTRASTGGLVGGLFLGNVFNSMSFGNIESFGDDSSFSLGGLAGLVGPGIISSSSSSVKITSYDLQGEEGGFFGFNEGRISDSYSSGNLIAYGRGGYHWNAIVGGFGGAIWIPEGFIKNSYSRGFVETDGSRIGGFLGELKEGFQISDSKFDIQASGQNNCYKYGNCSGAEGHLTAEMKQQSTYENWDFDNTWTMIEGETYPVLRSQFDVGQWARWPLDSIYNESGKQYTEEITDMQKEEALVNGAIVANGRVGNSLFFKRSEKDYVDTQSDFDLYNAFSISTWMKLQQTPAQGEYYVVMSKNNMPDEKSYAMFLDSANRLYFVFYPDADGSGEVLVSSVLDNPTTIWNHVAVVYDGEQLRLYINGERKSVKNAVDVRPADIQSNLIIGAQTNVNSESGYSDYYWGSIDDVRMYHRPLLEDEIIVLANGFD
ncbi:hypothetical protein COU60_01750 [Candidatus Pacearchaeota archaeon CG10_big_fil_rev_8_21_14_0_10_34_76]|nr:MAG: hypothetical protein COU60_01750 [Candidatus Pacearchaeota archaeon CG10_big_fil_rev_8_21_14_0_10_34_76]